MNPEQSTNEAISAMLELFGIDKADSPRVSNGVIDLPYNPEGAFKDANPYSIWWVFPKNSTCSYIVKGGEQDVRNYIRTNFSPSFCHKLVYAKIGQTLKKRRIKAEVVGTSQRIKISFLNVRQPFASRNFHCHRWVFSSSFKSFLRLKRLPKTWPKELDAFTEQGKLA